MGSSKKKPAKKAMKRPAAKKPAPAQPSWAEIKSLVGQMKGVLTWMKAEREQLRAMVDAMREMTHQVEDEAENCASEPAAGEAAETEAAGSCDGPMIHGDPVLSGALEDGSDGF